MNAQHHRSHRIWFAAAGLAVCAGILFQFKGCLVDEAGLLRSANEELAKHQYQQAEQLASRVLARTPHSIPALLIAGEAAAKSGRIGEAADYYARIPDDGSPASVSGFFTAAEALRELGFLSQAERSYRRVLQHDPENTQAQANMAFLLGCTGRRIESNEYLYRLLHQQSASRFVLEMLGDVDLAFEDEAYITKCRTVTPDDPLLLLGPAKKLLTDKPHEALPMLRKIVAALPQQLDAIAALGQALLETNSLDFFLDWHSKLSPEAESHPGIWTARGQWAWENGQPRAAARCYWEAYRLAPHSRVPNNMLGRILVSLNQRDQAEPFLQRTKWLNELSAAVRFGSARELSSIQQAAGLTESMGRLEEALAWARTALQINPRLKWARQTIDRLKPILSGDVSHSVAGLLPVQDIDLSTFPLPRWPKSHSSALVPTARVEPKSPPSGPLLFRDVALAAGIDFTYFHSPDPTTVGERSIESTGGGVGVLDFDGDGWPDLHFTQGCRWPPKKGQRDYLDRLYQNLGDGTFADVTLAAGVGDDRFSQGVTIGDYNSDGFADLYVANIGPNRLYRNNGDGTFSDVTSEAGILGNRWTSSCLLADLNGDAWPDIYDVNYLMGDDVYTQICKKNDRASVCNPLHFDAAPDQLYLNLGDGSFQEIGIAKGVMLPAGRGLGIIAADFDLNGRLDLFIANDLGANFYFVNQTVGPRYRLTLNERGVYAGVAFGENGLAQASMGVSAFDANGDGLIDLYLTHLYGEQNELYLQQTGRHFISGTRRAGLRTPSFRLVGWGTQSLDGELDGFPDLVVANGNVADVSHLGQPFRMRPQYFRNVGGGKFSEISSSRLGPYFQKKLLGRGLARLDWNRDGREDFAVSHLFSPVALVTNQTEDVGHFLSIRLRGVNSNRDAIGTIVRLKAGGKTWVSQLTAGDGYEASNQRQIVFGLGERSHVDELKIRWPSGIEQTFVDLATDQELLFLEGCSRWYTLPR